MKERLTKTFAATLISLASIAIIFTAGCSEHHAKNPSGSDTTASITSQAKPIQVGWMTSWVTAGQIIQAMIHTNIGTLYGAPLVYRSFLFGPDIDEAAQHGEVDCVNNGLVPTISLLAASPDWVVVSRLIDSPISVIARNGSNIKTIADLKGKSIAVPFGGGSHPFVLQRLEEVGLKVGDGPDQVHLVNLKPDDQATAMQQGSVDAVGTWEPQTAIMLVRGLGKVIDCERHIGVVTVRKSITTKDPASIVKLLKCYIEANYYVAGHELQAYKWFTTAARIDDNLRQQIKVIEPNTKAKAANEINIDLTDKDLALGQRFADTMFKAELIPTAVDFKSRTDLSFLEQAKKELSAEGFKSGQVTETPLETSK